MRQPEAGPPLAEKMLPTGGLLDNLAWEKGNFMLYYKYEKSNTA